MWDVLKPEQPTQAEVSLKEDLLTWLQGHKGETQAGRQQLELEERAMANDHFCLKWT